MVFEEFTFTSFIPCFNNDIVRQPEMKQLMRCVVDNKLNRNKI